MNTVSAKLTGEVDVHGRPIAVMQKATITWMFHWAKMTGIV